VATKIRLMRLGKIRAPYYRIVVADSRTKRDGRVIETIGKYHPKEDPSFIEVDSDRAQYWLGVGAQPTEPVAAILKVTGDWQKFKGLPAPTEGVKTAAPRPDRKAIFEAAAKESLEAEAKPATTKKATAKKAAPKPDAEAAPAATDEAAPAATDEATAADTGADTATDTATPDDQPAGTPEAPAPAEEAADAAAPDPDARPETSGDEPVQTAAAGDDTPAG
jgi:small subunit ribosomal protein S16